MKSWLTIAHFKNTWAILAKKKNLSFDICLFLLTRYKSCFSSYHAHHKSCWKSIHHVSWLRNNFRNNSARNIVIRNGKKHNLNKGSYNYLRSPTEEDHNSKRSQYSHVFYILFSCSGCGKFEKTLVCYLYRIETRSFLYILISKVGDKKGSVGLFQERFASILETHFQKELYIIIKIFKKNQVWIK